jgi:peptidoglycan/LPS O-acetylase OafA/YrhL
MSQKFRYDINGLRAFAVALVVLFHFGVFGFSGGFIGVDIFFVISGFLMTKIIISGIEKNQFNFWKFLISRANRIIPALVFLILVVTCVAWFTLLPQEFKDYSKHAITSLGFISNLQYFRESGYFDASSHEKLLLHTWSLSVEWQFYILLPLALLLVHKLFKNINTLKALYLFGFIVSFGLSVYISQVNQSAAFYLLPTRAWEMMAGGLIFLFFSNANFKPSSKKALELVGFGLIFLSTIFFTSESVWPGYNALIPVFGTFLILLAANNQSFFTNNKIAQFLGNTSYSIYLWHWPIVYYLGYFEKQNNASWIVFAIGLSILLGWLSYRFIETTTRKGLSNLNLTKSYIATISYLILPTLMLGLIFIKGGVPDRLDEKTLAISAQANNMNPDRIKCHATMTTKLPECVYSGKKVGLIVIGDSHADAMIRSVEKALPSKDIGVLDWTYNSCRTIADVKRVNSPGFYCGEVNRYILNNVKKYKNVPILVINHLQSTFPNDDKRLSKTPQDYMTEPHKTYSESYFNEMETAYINTICKLAENNPVYLTSPTPVFKFNIPKILGHRNITGNDNRAYIKYSDFINMNAKAINIQNKITKKCDVEILNTSEYFCDNSKCYADKQGIPLYYDDDHLSIYGADQLIPLFKTVF